MQLEMLPKKPTTSTRIVENVQKRDGKIPAKKPGKVKPATKPEKK